MSEHQSDIYQLINKTVADHVDQTTKELRTDIQDMKNLLQQYLVSISHLHMFKTALFFYFQLSPFQ